jgi:two-component system KDP operon response regulator KdpE
MLCYNGYDLVFAANGASALRAAGEYDPDLVLLDVGLPDANGIELCAALSAGPDSPPVVMLSGFAESRLGETARQAGCARYIEKPTNPVQVLHHIEGLIGLPPLAGVGTHPRVLNEADME